MYSILVVDDEKKECEGISKLLKRYGFCLQVSMASNGEEALKKFEKREYDILLTDIKMPIMNGIDLIKEVRKRGYHPVIRICLRRKEKILTKDSRTERQPCQRI